MAIHYYQLAVDHGDIPSITNLGLLYFRGQGVEKDENKAFVAMCMEWSQENH